MMFLPGFIVIEICVYSSHQLGRKRAKRIVLLLRAACFVYAVVALLFGNNPTYLSVTSSAVNDESLGS